MESDLLARWTDSHNRLVNLEDQISASTRLLAATAVFLFAINAAILLVVGGELVLQGALTVGMLVAFQSLMFSFSQPITDLLSLGSQIQEASGDLDLLDETLAYPPEPAHDEPDDSVLSGALELRNVTFGYNPLQAPFIEDFSLSIAPGERVALVGASGSGKSTIAGLIAGLYQPWRGMVLLDGVDRNALPGEVLSRSLALVGQEPALFVGTVRENLTLWDENTPPTDVWRAARDASVNEAILARPNGYNYLVEADGLNFSAGERQRLEIARALVNNPTLVVLDEATSALDSVTEAAVLENLGWRGCSSLVTTQRLSAIRDCDRIVVLDQGKIAEQGTHDELVASGGLYARLLAAETDYLAPGKLIPAWLQPQAREAAAPRREMPALPATHALPAASLDARQLVRFGLRGTRGDILLLVVAGLIAGALALVLPLLTAAVIDTALPTGDYSLLQRVGLALAGVALGLWLLQIVRNAAALRIQSHLDAALQPAIWERLLSLPAAFFRQFTVGDLAGRAFGVSEIRRILSDFATLSLVSGVFALVTFALLIYYDVVMALVALVVVAVAVLLTLALGGLRRSFLRTRAELRGETAGLVAQFLNGLAKLRVAGAEKRAFGIWSQAFGWEQRLTFGARRWRNLLDLLMGAYPVVAGLILFAVMYTRATLPLGEFLAFNLAFLQLNLAVVQWSGAWIALQEAAPGFSRLTPILETPPEAAPGAQSPGELQGAVYVQNLSFRYADDQSLALRDVSFRVEPGEFVAIVGASGAGKTTLLRLLLGFEQPSAGTIYYDEQPLSQIDLPALRGQIGAVLESARLIAGDIYSNIAGALDLSLEDAWRAARAAGIEDDIRRMPMGMSTPVRADGGTFSSGQRQRILIARALAAQPRVLLFDDATSTLDEGAQIQVMNALRRLDATRIVVSNSLSALAAADRIIVLQAGRIVETGTYATLNGAGGQFAALTRRQLSAGGS